MKLVKKTEQERLIEEVDKHLGEDGTYKSEYELIREKKSTLRRACRDHIIKVMEQPMISANTRWWNTPEKDRPEIKEVFAMRGPEGSKELIAVNFVFDRWKEYKGEAAIKAMADELMFIAYAQLSKKAKWVKHGDKIEIKVKGKFARVKHPQTGLYV